MSFPAVVVAVECQICFQSAGSGSSTGQTEMEPKLVGSVCQIAPSRFDIRRLDGDWPCRWHVVVITAPTVVK